MIPQLQINRLDPASGSRTHVYTAVFNRVDSVTRKSKSERPLRLPWSFATIEVVVRARPGSKVRASRNGTQQDLHSRGDEHTFLFVLKNDNEAHAISLSTDGLFALNLRIWVNHHYSISVAGKEAFLAPKRTFAEWGAEFARCRENFPWLRHAYATVDPIPKRIERGMPKSSEEWAAVLHGIVLEFARTLLVVDRNELISDFGVEESRGLEIQAILDETKRNPQLLEECAGGPFQISGKNYMTHAVAWRQERSDLVDLSVVQALIDIFAGLLRKEGCPLVTLDILARIRAFCQSTTYGDYRAPNSSQILALVGRQMMSVVGHRLQVYLLSIRALIDWAQAYGSEHEKAEQGLMEGIRDFDVFEWSVYLNVGHALGYSANDLCKRRPLFSSQPIRLLNCNIEGAAAVRAELLPGWRDDSKQPSGYQPDLVIFPENGAPIVLDAKFRMSTSDTEIAPGDAFKDIQAYLDEFELNQAIIVVPRLLINDIKGVEEFAIVRGPKDKSQKSIFVIELNPFNTERFERQLQAVLASCGIAKE